MCTICVMYVCTRVKISWIVIHESLYTLPMHKCVLHGAVGNSMLRPDGDTVFRTYVHIKEESYNIQDIRYKTLMGEDSEGVCVSSNWFGEWEEGKECFFLLTIRMMSKSGSLSQYLHSPNRYSGILELHIQQYKL